MKITKAVVLSLCLMGMGINCAQVAAYDNFELGCPCRDKKPVEPVPAPTPAPVVPAGN